MSNDFIKEHYDREVPSLSGGHYEEYRWFKNPLQAAHFTLTRNTINQQLLANLVGVKNILEIGPGPGTWTELLLERFPQARFTLVDISSQMLNEAKSRLALKGEFNFVNQDFTNFKAAEPFDLVFSSRAIEYVDNKEAFISNLAKSLNLGGVGFIITKTPHYWREWLLGKKNPARHSRQISPRESKKILIKQGLVILGSYPVTVSVPLFKSPRLNLWVARWIKFLPLNFITLNLTESYAIKFAKQEIIELFGLPASGKSTYARELEAGGYERIKVRTRWELIKYNFIFFFHYPNKFIVGLGYLIRYAGQSRWWYYKLMNLFFQHNAKFIKAQKFARAVIDQGHFQNLLSLFDQEQPASKLKKYASNFPLPNELIIFDLDPSERHKRLSYRPQKPRGEFGQTNQGWSLAAEANFNTVKGFVNDLKLPKYSLK